MFSAEELLPGPKCFLAERFGFGVLAHALVQQGQVIGGSRRIGMFSAKELLLDLERFQVEGFGFGNLALINYRGPGSHAYSI